MHLFFLTRGEINEVERLKKWLETRAFIMPVTYPDGSVKNHVQSGLLQPIQLWSYVFPEQALDSVLSGLQIKEKTERWLYDWKMKMFVEGLRKGMGAEKIPEYKLKSDLWLPRNTLDNISILPIGIKKDAVLEYPEGFKHEAI